MSSQSPVKKRTRVSREARTIVRSVETSGSVISLTQGGTTYWQESEDADALIALTQRGSFRAVAEMDEESEEESALGGSEKHAGDDLDGGAGGDPSSDAESSDAEQTPPSSALTDPFASAPRSALRPRMVPSPLRELFGSSPPSSQPFGWTGASTTAPDLREHPSPRPSSSSSGAAHPSERVTSAAASSSPSAPVAQTTVSAVSGLTSAPLSTQSIGTSTVRPIPSSSSTECSSAQRRKSSSKSTAVAHVLTASGQPLSNPFAAPHLTPSDIHSPSARRAIQGAAIPPMDRWRLERVFYYDPDNPPKEIKHTKGSKTAYIIKQKESMQSVPT
ncbi:hypothetical protein OC834_000336 [Tilletia horrida]|uniref:Uncharacterized protein n=1 Tax=Tilletia horrida TaxID=155126 RepID=A0AAN6GGT8_9BASI|nr:hypothetical protein OC842_001237 [Tilletia horrida]KAK0538622.1 hypothetical protein OC834_000336 [Tilletia horrida]